MATLNEGELKEEARKRLATGAELTLQGFLSPLFSPQMLRRDQRGAPTYWPRNIKHFSRGNYFINVATVSAPLAETTCDERELETDLTKKRKVFNLFSSHKLFSSCPTP